MAKLLLAILRFLALGGSDRHKSRIGTKHQYYNRLRLPSYSEAPGRQFWSSNCILAGQLSRKFVFHICLPGGLEDKQISSRFIYQQNCLPGTSLNLQISLPDFSVTTPLQWCQHGTAKRKELLNTASGADLGIECSCNTLPK